MQQRAALCTIPLLKNKTKRPKKGKKIIKYGDRNWAGGGGGGEHSVVMARKMQRQKMIAFECIYAHFCLWHGSLAVCVVCSTHRSTLYSLVNMLTLKWAI